MVVSQTYLSVPQRTPCCNNVWVFNWPLKNNAIHTPICFGVQKTLYCLFTCGNRSMSVQCSIQKTLNVGATSSNEHRSNVSSETLARRWGTSLDVTTKTLEVTTKIGIRNLASPLSTGFRTWQAQFRYSNLRTDVFFDALFRQLSRHGCMYARNFLWLTRILPKSIPCGVSPKLRTNSIPYVRRTEFLE